MSDGNKHRRNMRSRLRRIAAYRMSKDGHTHNEIALALKINPGSVAEWVRIGERFSEGPITSAHSGDGHV